MILDLKSIGRVIDTETLITYPSLENGGYDIHKGIGVDSILTNMELNKRLSDDEFVLIYNLKDEFNSRP